MEKRTGRISLGGVQKQTEKKFIQEVKEEPIQEKKPVQEEVPFRLPELSTQEEQSSQQQTAEEEPIPEIFKVKANNGQEITVLQLSKEVEYLKGLVNGSGWVPVNYLDKPLDALVLAIRQRINELEAEMKE